MEICVERPFWVKVTVYLPSDGVCGKRENRLKGTSLRMERDEVALERIAVVLGNERERLERSAQEGRKR